MSNSYVGRYAPSPSGRLHDGNLRTAALAWADARAHGGRFLLRIEDLDTPRNVPGAAAQALIDLEALGLDWDEPIITQSEHVDRYDAALQRLVAEGVGYPCRCSRRDIREAATVAGVEGPVYPGTCKWLPQHELEAKLAKGRHLAWRFDVGQATVETVVDRIQGTHKSHLATELGDFVIKRADGIIAYQLACVVDDLASGVTDIVRGTDLLSSCARQQRLWRALGGEPPRWAHLPLSVDAQGAKLSKRLRRWTDAPIDGPACLGRYAQELGWLAVPPSEPSPRLTSAEFLDLYRSHGWLLEGR